MAFACDMSALSVTERAAHAQLMHQVFGAVENISAVRDGYRLRLSSVHVVAAAQFIVLERACCPFFNFSLHLAASAATFDLKITGPEAVEPFIEAEFATALPTGLSFPRMDRQP